MTLASFAPSASNVQPRAGIAFSTILRGAENAALAALLRSTDYGVLMTDHAGTDVLCNARFGELFGIDPEVVVSSSRDEVREMALAVVRDPAEFAAVIERVYSDPTLEYEDELEVNTSPPRVLQRYTGPVIDEQGQNVGRVWTFRDISLTRRLQEQVRAYADRLEDQVRQQSADLDATTDVLQTMTAILAALTRARSEEELCLLMVERLSGIMGSACAALLVEEEGAFVRAYACAKGETARTLSVYATSVGNADLPGELKRKLAPGTEDAIVVPIRRRDRNLGLIFWGAEAGAAILDPRRRPHLEAIADQAGLVLRAHRLNVEIEARNEELRAAQDQMVLAAKVSAAGALSASVAHDIRNIMTPLRMELALIEDSETATGVRTQIDRLSALTHRLLALGKSETFHPAFADPAELANYVVQVLRPQAEVDRVELISHIREDGPRVWGDARLLEHLLVNLVLNAIHAMAVRGGRVEMDAEPEDGMLCLCVRDNGPGIDPQVLPRLFEPFFTTAANRSGLGLFSVKHIIEEHSGRIEVESEPGKGACFRIWLPMEEIHGGQAAASR